MFRILVLISLFVVLAVAAPPRRKQGCYCVPFFKSKTASRIQINTKDGAPLFNASHVTGDEGGGGNANCEDALLSCEARCKQGLRDEQGPQRRDAELGLHLGKKLCDAEGVEILSLENRTIFIEVRVLGCDAYKKIELQGKICCTECEGPVTRKNPNGIYLMYDQDCKTDPAYQNVNCPPELHAGNLI